MTRSNLYNVHVQTDLIVVAALLYLLLRRLTVPQVRYISLLADYFALFLILELVVSGIWMGYFTRVDIVVIETGLDLLSHPTLICYESGYSLHTLRQASRRSWRIGQLQPVRVYYLHYEDTVQTACLRLMGKKLLVSLAMEGKFSAEGLQALDDGDDMLTAMARELVTERGIGEPADAVWRQIQAEQGRSLPAPDATTEPRPVTSQVPPAAFTLLPMPSTPVLVNALKFGSRSGAIRSVPRKKRANLMSAQDQLALF